MQNSVCLTCQKPKAGLQCGLCKNSICKYCAQFVDEDSFTFLDEKPAPLSHTTYCVPCYDSQVAGPISEYNEILEHAKNVHVFFDSQGKETRLYKRSEKPVKVTDCDDEAETILRLAFFAAKANYNALIDVGITSRKVRNEAYQTTKWSGVGIPTQVNSDRFFRFEAK